MANEIELKLRIASSDLAHLRRHPAILAALSGKPVTRRLISIYYDTPNLALLDAGLSLRVRRMSGGWFQAVKAAGHALAGLHQRDEWEDIISQGHPDFSKITAPALTKIFDDPRLRNALAPIFTTDVRRTEWQLAWDNGDRIELALDLGDLIIGELREPIREIELELKGGDTARLFELALALQQDIPLELENISKAQRGYAHYRVPAPIILRAQPTHLAQPASADDAFKQIAWECLAQLQGNQDMVLHGEDLEGVHQMRVALRRLRSALRIFSPVIDQEIAVRFQAEIRWLSTQLGHARDLDVFTGETLPRLLQVFHAHPGLLQLAKKAEQARQQAYVELHSAMGSQRYNGLLLALACWLESGRWRQPEHAELSAKELASRVLSRHYKQLRRHGRRLTQMLPEERHEARLAAKRLRYAAEFFASLYPATRTQAFVRTLAKLQNTLGELNDSTVTESLLNRLIGPKPSRPLDQAAHLSSGWNARHGEQRLADMGKVWQKFAGHKPFWR